MDNAHTAWTRFVATRSTILQIASLTQVDQLDALFHPIHHPKSLWTRIDNANTIWAIFVDHEQAQSALDALTMHGQLGGIYPALQSDLLPYASLQKVDIPQWRAQQLQFLSESTVDSPEFTYEPLDDGTPVPPQTVPAPAPPQVWTPRADAAVFHPTLASAFTGGVHSTAASDKGTLRDHSSLQHPSNINILSNKLWATSARGQASRDPCSVRSPPIHDNEMKSNRAISNLSENGVTIPRCSPSFTSLPTTAVHSTGPCLDHSSTHDAQHDDPNHSTRLVDDPLNIFTSTPIHTNHYIGIVDDSSPTPPSMSLHPTTDKLVVLSANDQMLTTRMCAPSPFLLASPTPYATSGVAQTITSPPLSSTASAGQIDYPSLASISATTTTKSTVSIHSPKPLAHGFSLLASTAPGDKSLGPYREQRQAVAAGSYFDRDPDHGAGTKLAQPPVVESRPRSAEIMGANQQLNATGLLLPSDENIQPTVPKFDQKDQKGSSSPLASSPTLAFFPKDGLAWSSPPVDHQLEEGGNQLGSFSGEIDQQTSIGAKSHRALDESHEAKSPNLCDRGKDPREEKEAAFGVPGMLSMGMGIPKGRELAPITTDAVNKYTAGLDTPYQAPQGSSPAQTRHAVDRQHTLFPQAEDHHASLPITYAFDQPQQSVPLSQPQQSRVLQLQAPRHLPLKSYPTQKQTECSPVDPKRPTFSPFDMTRIVSSPSSTTFSPSVSNPSFSAYLSSDGLSSTSLASSHSMVGKSANRQVPPHQRIEAKDLFVHDGSDDVAGHRSFGAVGQAPPRFTQQQPHQPASTARGISMDDASLQALGGIEELNAIQQAVKAHQSNAAAAAVASRNVSSNNDQKRNVASSSFGHGSTQLLIPTTLGNSPPTPMVHPPVVINHKSKPPTTPTAHGMHGFTSPTSPAFVVRSPPIAGQNTYLAHQQYQQHHHQQRQFVMPTSYAALPGTTSSTSYAGISPPRTSTPAYTSSILHAPATKPPSLLTPSGRTFALGGRVRNVSDELNPILMFWPDNEPLPLACQIRPPAAVLMALGGVHGPPPPILNTGNKGPIDAQPGDWVCGKCDYLNWRRRRVCANCFPHAEGNTEGTKHSTAEVQERVALLASVLLHQQQQVQVQQQQIQAQQQAAAALLASNASGLNGIQMNSMNTPGTSHATALTSQRDALNGYGQTVPATRSSTAHTMNLPPRLGGSMDQTLPRFSNASTTSLPSMTSLVSTSSFVPNGNTQTRAQSNGHNSQNLRVATDFEVAPGSGRPSPPSARSSISAGSSASLSLPDDHATPSPLPLLPSFLQEVVGASDAESQSQSSSSLRGSPSPPSSTSASVSSSSFHRMSFSRSSDVVYQPSPKAAAVAGHGETAGLRTVGSMDLVSGAGGWKEASHASTGRIGHDYPSELGRRPSQSSIWSLGYPPEKQ